MSRDFVVRQPQVAARLIERAGQMGTDGLGPALDAIAQLRFRSGDPLALGSHRPLIEPNAHQLGVVQ